MFTVCPKCSLTLVVTAQDLRVAQGYVRCGRCSNVFNAIVGLTDDRGNSAAASQGTASTTIMRKAPSIPDEPDPLSETGETEMIYAEPAPPAAAKSSPPQKRAPDSQKRYSDTEGIEEKRYSDTQGVEEKRYSDTEGIETYPEHELEFNPNLTDVTKVFVEAAPVTIKANAATGQFEKIVLKEDGTPATPARTPQPAPSRAPQKNGRVTTAAAAATPVSTPDVDRPRQTPAAATAATSSAAMPAAPNAKAPPPPAQKPARKPAQEIKAPPPPARHERDDEDIEIDAQLRSFAERLDVTANRRAAGLPTPAANEEALESAREIGESADEDEDRSIGDIYAPATPRPSPPRSSGQNSNRRSTRAASRAGNSPAVAVDDQIEAVGVADTLAPAPPKRNRFMLWVGGAAVLSLGLVAQAIHHNRHDLATNAVLNRPLTRFYKAIGVTLVPNWDLTAYDIRQLGASTNERGPGTLTVRASLKNNAPQSLPLPLLRITMQDRYGNRIATRDVLPVGYVPGTVPPDAQLGIGQRIDAEMTFKDPGQDAVGFEIDACLPSASGRIVCANDAAPPSR